ncbi:hypothetical protein [Deinococcus sp. RM]|uniref:hypothetical protein n=1 Tax=Deinococcus sp. RM TaxID=2316359 RepID=UPI000E67F47F|nr:hypothetical protein [Deinococcus sp. RM]RIY05568.1 hypothetical protein D3W47_09925 [Deinococcus sp. RM]
MLKSELARELNLDASVMSKKCKDYFVTAGKPDERYLSSESVNHLREAATLIELNAARTWREAIDRVLGQYAAPVPSEGAREIVQRIDQLETKVTHVAEQITLIATYLRERAERQGSARAAGEAGMGATTYLQPNG